MSSGIWLIAAGTKLASGLLSSSSPFFLWYSLSCRQSSHSNLYSEGPPTLCPYPPPQVLRNGRLGRGPPRLHCSQLWRNCCLWSLSSECTYSAMTSETQWPPQAAGRTGCRAVFVTAAQTLVLAHVSLGQSLVGRSTRPSRQAAPRGDWTVEGVQWLSGLRGVGGKWEALGSILRKMWILDPVK